MTDEHISRLRELECRIKDSFPSVLDNLEYLNEMKKECASGGSRKYLDMAFGISAMYFKDAIKLVPIVLLVETSLKIKQVVLGGFPESVYYWICGLSCEDLRHLSRPQLMVIKQWLDLVASDGCDDGDLDKAIKIVDSVIGNESE